MGMNVVEVTPKQTGITNKNLKNATESIIRLQNEAKKNLFGIAVALATVDKNKWYEQDGFKTTADYAEQVFKYRKAMTSALIRTANKYIDGTDKKKYHSYLAIGDKDYTVSQLQELLPIELKQAKELQEKGMIKPEMTTKKIREVIKVVTGKDKGEESKDKGEEKQEKPASEETKEKTASEEKKDTQETVGEKVETLVPLKEVLKEYDIIADMVNKVNKLNKDLTDYIDKRNISTDENITRVKKDLTNTLDKLSGYVSGLVKRANN